MDPKKLITPWFTLHKLKRCYADGRCGLNGMNLWEVTTNVRVMLPKEEDHHGKTERERRVKQGK